MQADLSISSLGGIGGTASRPIIKRAEVRFSRVEKRDQADLGRQGFRAATDPAISLSYDHRVIDGAAAARFTTYLCQCSPTCDA